MATESLRREARQREINFFGTEFLFVRSYHSANTRHPFIVDLHLHEWHEFVWAIPLPAPAGTPPSECTIEGQVYPFPTPSLFYTPPFRAHHFSVTGPLRNWIVGIDPVQASRMFAHSPLGYELERLFDSWKAMPARVSPDAPGADALTRCLSALADAALTPGGRAGAAPSVLEALHFLVSFDRLIRPWFCEETPEAAGFAGTRLSTAGAGSERMVRDAMAWLELHFMDQLSVDDCARAIGVSRSSLSHSFRTVTGQSIPRALNDIRLRHARALLVTTDLEIIDVAMECGFNDQAWFSRQFKSLTGLSPSHWRVRAREDQAREVQAREDRGREDFSRI